MSLIDESQLVREYSLHLAARRGTDYIMIRLDNRLYMPLSADEARELARELDAAAERLSRLCQ